MNYIFKQLNFIDSLLNGISQIMLQENRWTGLLFLTGLFIGSWQFAIAALLAALTGNVTAIVLKYNLNDISNGLYGFNSALFGVALIFLFKPAFLIWLLLVVGSILATLLQHFFIKRKFPGYTFPFILITWLFVFIIRNFLEIPTSIFFNETFSIQEFDVIAFGFRSFGQIIFQQEFIPGFIFFTAVFINSRSAAMYGIAAAFATGYMAYILGQPLNIIYSGAFGFNAVLSAIVFSGTRKVDFIWVAVAVILTFFINLLLFKSGILNSVGGILTFAFVAGTWITLLLKRLEGSTQRLKTRKESRGINNI